MHKKRTNIDFSEHEVIVTKQEDLLVHYLKKPGTRMDSIKFINTHGIMAVTGDYGNYIFCREFHPEPDGYVSDEYWKQKLKNSSSQEPDEFDSEGTIEDIKRELEQEEDLTDEEKEYLNECLSQAGNTEHEYKAHAYNENVGRYEDGEYVPISYRTKIQLQYIFDGFEGVCRRMKYEVEEKELDGRCAEFPPIPK